LKLGVFAGFLNSFMRYYSITNEYNNDVELFELNYHQKTVAEEEAPKFPDLSKSPMVYGLVYGRDYTDRYHPRNFKKSVKYINE
jgi:hypothetical protein